MSKEDAIEVMATVIEPLPNAMFKVNWKTSTRCWRMFRARCARISSAFCRETRWRWSLSPYDLNRGRIVYRYK